MDADNPGENSVCLQLFGGFVTGSDPRCGGQDVRIPTIRSSCLTWGLGILLLSSVMRVLGGRVNQIRNFTLSYKSWFT
jgi:hypothetical protein